MNSLVVAGVLMALLAIVLIATPLLWNKEGRAPWSAVLAALAIPVGAVFLYLMATNYPWGEPASMGMGGPALVVDTPEIIELQQQLAADPENASLWERLGDAYLLGGRPAEAREAYGQAIATGDGEDDMLQLAFAEASVLADPSAIQGEAGAVIESALDRDPDNPRALWYGGMAAFGRGDTGLAIQRWRRLLELSPPPQIREILEQQLAMLGIDESDSRAADAGEKISIPVQVSVSPALSADSLSTATVLFVVARAAAAGEGQPPLAAIRHDAAALPLELAISDADMMLPGRSLAGHEAIELVARLSTSGDASPRTGDPYGTAIWRPADGTDTAVQIVIDRLEP